MSDANVPQNFLPAEWVGAHFRPIGGSYGSLDLAVEAVEGHFRNKHGSGALLQVFRPGNPEATSTAALIEAGPVSGDPLQAKALYKVLVSAAPR